MNKYPILITEETIKITPLIFNINGEYWERSSVDYFFNLVRTKKSTICNIVDIGAHSGLYTLYAKYLPECIFYSYEPYTKIYNLLLENCRLNNIVNANLFNYALGKENEVKNLSIPKEQYHCGLTSLSDKPLRFTEYTIQPTLIKTLDSEFFDKDIPVHFIKCDTEGWELYILEGGIKTLQKWKPDIFLEIHETNLKQCNQTKESLLLFLSLLNYKIVDILDGENYHFTYDNKPVIKQTAMYITNGQRKDGFGAQLLNLIWDIIFAEEYGNEFVYSDIDSMEHNYDNDPKFIDKLIEYTNIKKHYLTFNKIKKLQPLYQHVHYAMRDFIEADVERYYTGEPFKRFKKNFLEGKTSPYSPSFVNVAVHIRRPNNHDSMIKGANIPDEYYLQLINAIRSYGTKEKPILFHIYSQGDLAKFTKYKAPDVIFHLDTDLCDTFTGLVFGDILITSASALSYCAALLSSGSIYYVKFWHPPMKHWTVIG